MFNMARFIKQYATGDITIESLNRQDKIRLRNRLEAVNDYSSIIKFLEEKTHCSCAICTAAVVDIMEKLNT